MIRCGPSRLALESIIRETQARAVFWNRRYEPLAIARDAEIKSGLRTQAIDADSFNAALLYEPWRVRSAAGTSFKVFTPFWKACLASGEPSAPGAAPTRARAATGAAIASESIESLGLLPQLGWADGLARAWTPGEEGGQRELDRFLESGITRYREGRDIPGEVNTSRLSPHLHCGEISPRRIWERLRSFRARGTAVADVDKFLAEIGWREFAHHLLFHSPETITTPLRRQFERFPWRSDPAALRAWQRGETGYPLVDAGMRELWQTGWMHNRVRMVVASFLVKHLLLPWQDGAAWFWDTLVDADLANNTLGWQWVAGCGADAAPYFRIFNPTTQSEKFDPHGAYIRRFVPELAALPDADIHEPAAASSAVLAEAGVILGRTYPRPIVDHPMARARALEALSSIRLIAP